MDQQEEKNNENKNNKRNNCLILYQNINCAYTFRPEFHSERNRLFVCNCNPITFRKLIMLQI